MFAAVFLLANCKAGRSTLQVSTARDNRVFRLRVLLGNTLLLTDQLA